MFGVAHARDAEFEESKHPRGQKDNAGQFAKKSEIDPKVHASMQKKGFTPSEGEEARYKHASGHEISFLPKKSGTYAYEWRHDLPNEGGHVKTGYGVNILANQIGKIQRGEIAGGEQKKNFIPDSDDEITPEVLKKTLDQLPAEARTPEGAERYFETKIKDLASRGKLTFFHESPGDQSVSIKQKGLGGEFADHGVYAAINEPSKFVTTDVKTEVQYAVPPNELRYVYPDESFGWSDKLSAHQVLLLKHPDLSGAYVTTGDEVPPRWIKSVKVLRASKANDDNSMPPKIATDPPVSEKQRRAMFVAKAGHSSLGIPQSVGKEFVGADPGGALPERRARDMAPSKWARLRELVAQWLTDEEQEPEHAANDEEPTTRAAGVAFVTPSGEALFLRRSAHGDHSGEWCLPGGVIEDGETPEGAAIREAKEETGADAHEGAGGLMEAHKHRLDGVEFTTFYQPVAEQFVPTLNDEHTEARWASIGEAPDPLHPGVRATIDEIMAGLAEDDSMTDSTGGFIEPPPAPVVAPPSDAGDCAEAKDSGLTPGAHGHLTVGRQRDPNGGFGWAIGGRVGTGKNQMRMARVVRSGKGAANVARDMALDRALATDKRVYDRDGHLHVDRANISKAAVNPYLGAEINGVMKGEPGWRMLDPDRRYMLLRHPEELRKATGSFNGKPILFTHKPASATDHPSDITVGAAGNDASYEHPYMRNSLSIWPAYASEAIDDGSQKQISAGYAYRADMTPGTYEGERYDGVMRDIVCNHLALVREGRAGADVAVDRALIGWRGITTAIRELRTT